MQWNGSYIIARENLLADMCSKLHADTQGQKTVMNIPDKTLHHDLDVPSGVGKIVKKVSDQIKRK